MPADDIDYPEGKINPHILLIAPHAPIVGKIPRNDRNTGRITEQIQKKLGCPAIINSVFRKPIKKYDPPDLKNMRLDFNIISHAKLHPTFLKTIKAVIDSNEKTIVLWIHGLADTSAHKEGSALIKKKVLDGKPENLHALIGFGQGNDPHTGTGGNCRSAHKDTAKKLADFLTAMGMTTKLTRKKATNFRGRDPNRMNQWFNNQKYPLSKVESIQIEIKEAGFRDSKENIAKTADIIEKAVSFGLPLRIHQRKSL